jgi:anti-anti-sigma factor
MAATKAETRDGVLVVRFLEAELADEMHVREIGGELAALISHSRVKQLLLNFEGVSFMSSSMLGQLAILTKRCMSGNISLKLCEVGETIREVLRIVRLDTLAEIVADEETALGGFRADRKRHARHANTLLPPDLKPGDTYREAAEAGDAASQYCLGQCCENGHGVALDFDQAIAWYRKAAVQGHAEAEYALATAYAFGMSVLQDYDEAVKWYRKSADQGHGEAQYAMGMNCMYGIGVKQDLAQAKKWYRLAAAQGHSKAKDAFAQLQSD